MSSLTDLREVVDVVIGVDTHVHTHSAAVVDARTGGVLDEITVEATADGYHQLVEFVDGHAALEVGLVGREGMVGIPLALGVDISPVRALVQGAGSALQMSTANFRKVFDTSPPLQRALHR